MPAQNDPHTPIGDLVIKILERQMGLAPHEIPRGRVHTDHLQNAYVERNKRGR